MYSIKLSEAAKKLGKKFACGASVTKDATQKEQIDVQGDYIYDMPPFLLKTYKAELESANIVIVEDKKRTPYKP